MDGNFRTTGDPVQHRADESELMEAGAAQGGESQSQANIHGSNFEEAHFGSHIVNTNKTVGHEGADYRGANIASTTNIYVNQGGPQPSQHAGTSGKKPEYRQLTPSIRIFPNRQLRKTLTATIFEGEIHSNILEMRRVAVKVVNYTEKNCREAKNLIKLLPHTNVVAIIDANMVETGLGNRIYIVMDRCQTLNLEEYIKDRKSKGAPFNLQEAASHASQVVDAIHHIHRNGIVHRDLKPTSVLFSLCGKHLKIADFGVSKQLENGRSVMSVSMLKVGTDGYRAPETYLRNELSKKADIFSLGLVLFHLWSYGLHPFGIDPEIWNFNIKNKCQGLDMSGLLLPNPENAKSLLKEMFKFVPEERFTINEVKSHVAVTQEVSRSVMDTMKEIWKGKFEGAEEIACTVYQMPDGPNTGLTGADWTFRMNAVPRVDLVSMKKIVNEAPTGYIATWSRDAVKRLTENFEKKKMMGWANVLSPAGERSKSLVLTGSQGFPELFGIFVENPGDFTSRIQTLISTQEVDEKDSPDVDPPSNVSPDVAVPASSETVEMPEVPQALHEEVSVDESPSDSLEVSETVPKEVMEEDQSEIKQTVTVTDSEHCGPPELIPWWYIPTLKTS